MGILLHYLIKKCITGNYFLFKDAMYTTLPFLANKFEGCLKKKKVIKLQQAVKNKGQSPKWKHASYVF